MGMIDKPLLKGAPMRLSILDFRLFRVHANDRVIGICGCLVQTDAGESVLVDSGFPARYAEDAEQATQEDRLFEFGAVLACRPEHQPQPQLALAGVAPEDIDLFILTLTHIDHVGGIAEFPHAPMVVSAAERGHAVGRFTGAGSARSTGRIGAASFSRPIPASDRASSAAPPPGSSGRRQRSCASSARERRRGDVRNRRHETGARIVYQRVDSAGLRSDRVEGGYDGRAVGDVQRHGS